MRRPRCSEVGLTTIEVIIASGIFAVMFLGIGAMMNSGARHSRTVQLEALLVGKARELADIMTSMTFGSAADAAATATEVDAAFDANPDASPTSLQGLCNLAGGAGLLIPTTNPSVFPDGFPVPGVFRVRIERAGQALLDAARNDDPTFALKLESGDLADETLIRISVSFRRRGEEVERLILHSYVVSQAQNQE